MNVRVKIARRHLLRMLDGFPVQLPTSVGLLEFEAGVDQPWVPMRRVPVNPEIIRRHAAHDIQAPDETWVNDVYDCIVTHSPEGPTHLSIKRLDRAPIRNWRHFQQIKNEVVGEDREAVEIYPAEDRLVDNANQYHLWVLPADLVVPLGFDGGMVTLDPHDVETFNRNPDKSRQEPLQEGLTIGEVMEVAQDGLSDEDGATLQRTLTGGV